MSMNYAGPLICISFFNKYYILTESMLIEPMNEEPQIQKANYKVLHGFLTGSGGSMPLTSTFFKGQLLNESVEHLKSRQKVNQIRTRIGEMSGSH